MTFQIHSLDPQPFARLFELDDEALSKIGARREIVGESPGSPCRVSLEDAEVGCEVLLLNYTHLPELSPYRASHAIYIRKGAEAAHPAPGQVPKVLSSRLLSLRVFGADHFMIEADVVDGASLTNRLNTIFANQNAAYVHIHNAKQGCFAARATRA